MCRERLTLPASPLGSPAAGSWPKGWWPCDKLHQGAASASLSLAPAVHRPQLGSAATVRGSPCRAAAIWVLTGFRAVGAMHRELQGCRQLLPWHLLQPACCMVCRGGEELLIKWEGMGYDELSWERRASLKDVDAKIAAFKGQQSIATKVTLLLPRPQVVL